LKKNKVFNQLKKKLINNLKKIKKYHKTIFFVLLGILFLNFKKTILGSCF